MTTLLSQFKTRLGINPIVVKEIRSRMRGARAFVTLTVLLVVMGAAMYGMLQIILANSRYSTILSPQVGQALFASLAFLELFMISAVTPAVTSSAISSEKEKQTYEMLVATPLSPASILWGKLVSALSYIFLLIFAGVPLASVVFIFGGVAPREMGKALLVLLVIAVTFGVMGMFYSALFGRSGRATVASFITVILMMLGPLFLAVLIAALRSGEPPRWLLAPSPISALSSALAPSIGQNAGGEIFFFLGGIFNTGINPISQNGIPRPMYHYSLPLYIMLSVVLYMLASRLVQPTRRWRIPMRDVLVGLAIVSLLAALIIGLFVLSSNRYEQVRPNGGVVPGNQMIEPLPARPIFMDEKPIQIDPAQTVPDAGAPQAVPAQPVAPSGRGDNAGGGPVGGDNAGPGPILSLDMNAQADIYAAVARQLFTKDHSFGGKLPPAWQVLYLVAQPNDGPGGPNAAADPQARLDPTLQGEISKRLADLNVKVIWVDTPEQVKKDPQNGTVQDGQGVVITIGNLQPQPDGSVHVAGSLYFSILGAGGRTYILINQDGSWKISGTTGVEWIS